MIRNPAPQAPSIRVDAPFFQAGLAGYSDAAMRLVARRHGCPYCVTEAMLDKFLTAGGKGRADAQLTEHDHPIAGQLMGSHAQDMVDGAEVLLELGYDVIDLNLACPVKKIKRKARGGHLLSDPDEAIAILAAVAERVAGRAPITVKLRRAYDDTPEMEAAFHRVFEACLHLGLAGATVHCRTVHQKYLGPGRWSFLRDLAQHYGLARDPAPWFSDPNHALRITARKPGDPGDPGSPADTFTLGGSGDIWRPEDALRMLQETGVHWVSIARGCIGDPWFFARLRALLANSDAPPPTLFQQRDVLLEHFRLSVDLHGEKRAGRMMRKFGIKFSRHHPEAEAVRKAFIAVTSLEDWQAALDAHYAHDGPGASADDALPDEAEYVTCEEAVGA
ncbi:MAG: tRNA-dihydrouridine synthase family protein [Planctomycetota bacterium]